MLNRKITPGLVAVWVLCVYGGVSNGGALLALIVALAVSGAAAVFSANAELTVLGAFTELLAVALAVVVFLKLALAKPLVMVLIPLAVLHGLLFFNVVPPFQAVMSLAFSLLVYVPVYFLLLKISKAKAPH